MMTIAKTFTAVERIERLPLTSYQIKIFAAIAFAWFFDIVDIAMITFALAALKDFFHLDKVQTGLLGSSAFAGMFIGTALSGILADKFGRKTILQWSIIIWGVASFLCAAAQNIGSLMLFRIFLGIGMGMETPVAQTLACELVATKYRGRCVAALEGIVPLGAISAGLIAYFLLPHFSWRALFLTQGITAAVVIFVRRYIPESPRWLEQVGKTKEAVNTLERLEKGVLASFNGKPLPEVQTLLSISIRSGANSTQQRLQSLVSSIYLKRSIMLGIIWFLISMSYHGLKVWLTTLLHAKGYSIIESNSYLLIMSFAGIPGFLTAYWLVEKYGRKLSLVPMLIGLAVSFWLFSGAVGSGQIILYGLFMQFCMFGLWCPLYLYTSELYPTNARATGTGCSIGFGRLGAILGPTIIGFLLTDLPQINVFDIGAIMLLIAALVVLLLGEETKGRLLENISPS